MDIRRIIREILKEEISIGPGGEMSGKGEIEQEMEKYEYAFEAQLSSEFYGQTLPKSEVGDFTLDYDDEGVHWVHETGNYLIDIDLFKNNQFVMGITLYKIVEPGEEGELSLGEWKELKHKEVLLHPSILKGNYEDVSYKYMFELKKFIQEVS
jgi:hypothetical protein